MRNYVELFVACIDASAKDGDGNVVFQNRDFALVGNFDELDDEIESIKDGLNLQNQTGFETYFDVNKPAPDFPGAGQWYWLLDKDNIIELFKVVRVFEYYFTFFLLQDQFQFESPKKTWSHGH